MARRMDRQTGTGRPRRSVSRNIRISEGLQHPDLEVDKETKKKDKEEDEEEEEEEEEGEEEKKNKMGEERGEIQASQVDSESPK